jgi:hypothetical protein
MLSFCRTSLLFVVAAACSGGADLGEPCGSVSDCADGLQCLNHICVPRCARHVDCGDGFICRPDGVCEVVETEIGDACIREHDCAAGQSCQLAGTDLDGDGILTASCQPENSGGLLDDPCEGDTQEEADQQCRTGTCALGRCVDVCADEIEGELDCPVTHTCTTIPRETTEPAVPSFYGCLPRSGQIVFPVPIDAAYARFILPVPGHARSVAVIAEIDDPVQLVGAAQILSPDGDLLYQLPLTREEYFDNRIRHEPMRSVSTVLIPQDPDDPLVPGGYPVEVGSYIDVETDGTEIPDVDVVYKLDDTPENIEQVTLDVHFYFLDLDEHPCAGDPDFDQADLDGRVLDAEKAKASAQFNDVFLVELGGIFARAGIVLDRQNATYTDILDRPNLDGLDASRLGDLLSLSEHPGGISVFFVRTISPAGLQGLVGGPPAPPGRPGTRGSGVAIGVDQLCYRDWHVVARNTAHEIARAMGLHRSVEPDGYVDPIGDSGSQTDNLMYFSEFGGDQLSSGQSDILRLSSALR